MALLRNPILSGFYPDPSICRVGQDYYLATSSFEYFPGVPLFHSRDLTHWCQIGHCLNRPSQLPLGKAWISGGIYAPTLRYHNGVFYMITTNTSEGGNFVVSATDPAGPWSEPLWLDIDGIDPDLFFDTDGAVYVTSSGRSGGTCKIVQRKIDIATGACLSAQRDIWEGTGGHGPEGPHLYRIGEWYYLMIAEGGTEYGHMEVIARGHAASGPWEACPRNPILTHRSSGGPIQATGHGDLVQAHDGSWWMVHLGIRPQGYHACHTLGRETFLSPVTWDIDGWPVVGSRGMAEMTIEAPLLEPSPWPSEKPRDDFNDLSLGLCWNCIRNPVPGHWSLTDRPGHLTLHGGPGNLDNMQPTPCFIGRRQQHHAFACETLLDFEPSDDRDEAGLTVFQNMEHHYEIFVSLVDGVRKVSVRRRIGSLAAVTASLEAPPGPIVLRVEARAQRYYFGFTPLGGAYTPVADGESRYLSTEVGGRFTGVYLAMYASGNGVPSGAPALYDWFEYVGTEKGE